MYRCSRCKQTGHNARTCGTAPQTLPARRLTSTTSVPGTSTFNENSHMGGAYKKLDAATTIRENTPNTRAETPEPPTAEEMETLWALSTAGRKGKRQKGGAKPVWDSEDTTQLCAMFTTFIELGAEERTLKRFFNSFGKLAKVKLIESDTVPPKILEIASKDSRTDVRSAVAYLRYKDGGFDNIPPPALQNLLTDSSVDIQHLLLINYDGAPNLSAEQVQTLRDHPPVYPGDSETEKENQHAGHLGFLLKAENCPTSILENVIDTSPCYEDPWRAVVTIALSRTTLPSETLTRQYERFSHNTTAQATNYLCTIVSNEAVSPKIVAEIFDKNYETVAERNCITRQEARRLRDRLVLAALNNTALPGHIIEEEYRHPTVSENFDKDFWAFPIVANPNTPSKVLEHIAQTWGSEKLHYRIADRARQRLEWQRKRKR